MSILYDTQTKINKMVLCHEQQIKDIAEHLLKLKIKRKWVGLTDEDFLEACQIADRGNYLVAFQRIQNKLKQKNND